MTGRSGWATGRRRVDRGRDCDCVGHFFGARALHKPGYHVARGGRLVTAGARLRKRSERAVAVRGGYYRQYLTRHRLIWRSQVSEKHCIPIPVFCQALAETCISKADMVYFWQSNASDSLGHSTF